MGVGEEGHDTEPLILEHLEADERNLGGIYCNIYIVSVSMY